MCRVYVNGRSSAPRDIALDEQTALLILPGGSASVVGQSMVYFMQAAIY